MAAPKRALKELPKTLMFPIQKRLKIQPKKRLVALLTKLRALLAKLAKVTSQAPLVMLKKVQKKQQRMPKTLQKKRQVKPKTPQKKQQVKPKTPQKMLHPMASKRQPKKPLTASKTLLRMLPMAFPIFQC